MCKSKKTRKIHVYAESERGEVRKILFDFDQKQSVVDFFLGAIWNTIIIRFASTHTCTRKWILTIGNILNDKFNASEAWMEVSIGEKTFVIGFFCVCNKFTRNQMRIDIILVANNDGENTDVKLGSDRIWFFHFFTAVFMLKKDLVRANALKLECS